MSSQRFATPLRLRVEHSRRLQAVVISFFILSLLALLIMQLTLSLKLPIILAVMGLYWLCWKKRSELGGRAVELILRPNGAWLLHRNGVAIPLELLGESTVTPWLLLLCFKEQHGRRRFEYLLWEGEQPAVLFRRLRIYLRVYGGVERRLG